MPQDFVFPAAGPVQPVPFLQLMNLQVHCKTFQPSDAKIYDSFPLPTPKFQQTRGSTLPPTAPSRLSLLTKMSLLTVDGRTLMPLTFFPVGKKGLSSNDRSSDGYKHPHLLSQELSCHTYACP